MSSAAVMIEALRVNSCPQPATGSTFLFLENQKTGVRENRFQGSHSIIFLYAPFLNGGQLNNFFSGLEVIIFFMLNSAEHEILNARKYKNILKNLHFQAQISLECYFSCS